MNKTSIEWTDFASNPIRFRNADGKTGWACEKVSPGCAGCYAERLNRVRGTGLDFTTTAMKTVTPYLDEIELRRLEKSKSLIGKSVFIEDMSDLFGDWVRNEWLDRVFNVIAHRREVTFQILTKRIGRALNYVQGRRLPNMWIGVSVENQETANRRIPLLAQTDASRKFLSCEPLLGPVDIGKFGRVADWVIVGGESGPQARPMDPLWVRKLRDDCAKIGIPFFFKQWGEWLPASSLVIHENSTFKHRPIQMSEMMYQVGRGMAGRKLDGREHNAIPEITLSVTRRASQLSYFEQGEANIVCPRTIA
jgi:protein gp37